MTAALLEDLVADITDGILVLRERDGVAMTTGQAMERARNIVAGLMGNYEIQAVVSTPRSRLTAQAWAVQAALEPRDEDERETT
jgi:hypothetical protein